MRVSREKKKAEAIKRMKKWDIFSQTIEQFDKEGLISISKPPYGAFYWVEDEQLEAVKRFETKHNALVYCIVRTYTNFGKMDAYLYVSDYAEEWELDNECQDNGEQMAYVVNYDMPEWSEFGTIGLKQTIAGGLARTW